MLINLMKKFLSILLFMPFVIALLFALPKGVFAGKGGPQTITDQGPTDIQADNLIYLRY